MIYRFLRPCLAIASVGFIAAVAIPVDAARQALGTIRVVGVDNVCDSFTLSYDATATVLTCVPPNSPPSGAPTGCVATVNTVPNAVLPSSGGSVNLAVTCASPTTGITYNWARNGSSNANSAASWTDTSANNALLGPNTTSIDRISSYQVQVCAGAACVIVPSAPLTVTVPPAGTPPPDGWNGTCPGFAATMVVPLNWASPTRMYTANFGGRFFGPNDALVLVFTTGNVSSTTSLPRIGAAEHNSQPSARTAVLSSSPCDFGPQLSFGATIKGNSITSVFALGTGTGFGFYPVLQTNTTYYLNIKNDPNPVCAINNVCDMFIDLMKPGGM